MCELVPCCWLSSGDKIRFGSLVTSGCLLSIKVQWADWIGSFCPKSRYFTAQNGSKRRPMKNKNKCYKQLERRKYLVSMFPSWVMVLKLSKKCIFCNFVLTLARNLSLLKQFTFKKLKVLITIFKKIKSIIGVWATVHEIFAIKMSKKMLTQQNFNKIILFQTLVSLKQ